MAINKNLKKVVILGSGPIKIGQACEFDYSGTQACKALMKEGLEVVLINSNPATIMTDPELASRVYIEPLNPKFVKPILEKEKPDAVIPTLGGQTALNLALDLHADGVLQELGIELLGAKPEVIEAAEDREKFCRVLDQVGANYPKSYMVRNFEDGMNVAEKLGVPIILRPNYTLGGGGGGIAYDMEEYREKLAAALHESPTSEVLVEESIMGWKEYELEVMRDCKGTFVVICSIENFDPCGVHTGDSITVAPQQTLTDRQYQEMRDEAQKIVNAVGVETGGANIQFAVHPETGERVVIEMNPRVSRSSALASKATGFPIAKIAALLAVGYALDELKNDITKTTPSCYEPALDYVVTKIPRFDFQKFPGSKDLLNTQMKSVGEVMGIGRTLQESFMKAIHSMEGNAEGLPEVTLGEQYLSYPCSQRIFHIAQAFREGWSVERVSEVTLIHSWFLEQFSQFVKLEKELKLEGALNSELVLRAKRSGLSDAMIGKCIGQSEKGVREWRRTQGLCPEYLQVDTCAGEFASETPYFYSTYWSKRSSDWSERSLDWSQRNSNGGETVVLLGSGPNRIGQGIEFDYSCVRSVGEFQNQGYRVAMINSNPETVSTDYDTSNFLFFEPLTEEHVLEVMHYLRPKCFVAQLGGQTPINLAPKLVNEGFELLGSSLESIDLAEDRARFIEICQELKFRIPLSGMATDFEHAKSIAEEIGYPVICRPSYVLGGRRMEIVENLDDLQSYFERYGEYIRKDAPCLMDQFLDRALEVDVDLVRGPDWTVVGGIVEHIEAAGVHSGDSMGVIPPQRLRPDTYKRMELMSRQLADRIGILGFLNLQLAIKNDEIFMIEANPRSSRSVPFIGKATSIPIVNLGVKGMLGMKANEVSADKYVWQNMKKVCVKGVVFPFKKFSQSDSLLGPEMKSTGESMGRGEDYSEALLKALFSSQVELPLNGEVFLSLREKDKSEVLEVARELNKMGYTLSATKGTANFLSENKIDCTQVKKVHEGRPHCVDRIRSGQVAFVINTASGRRSVEASWSIRRSCIDYSIPCITEADAAKAFILALNKNRSGDFGVDCISRTQS